MKNLIIAFTLLGAMCFYCCKTTNKSIPANAQVVIDSIYYDGMPVREPMSVEQYQQYIKEYKRKYSNLMVKEIHSPLSISKEYFERYMEKFRQRVDSMIPGLIDTNRYAYMLKTDQLKTQADLDLCTFDIIPTYRLTANIMDIKSYKEQQFADFFTLDTSGFVIMIRKYGEIIDLIKCQPDSFSTRYWGMDYNTKPMVEVGLKETDKIFGLYRPENEVIPDIYAYIKNGRMYFPSPIGDVFSKDETGKKIGLHWLFEYVDNERAFDFGHYATTWLDSYFRYVEVIRKYDTQNYPKSIRNPQVIFYPQKD